MIRLKDKDYKHIVQRILCIMREYRCLQKNAVQCESVEYIAEENTFYVFRTDTQTVLTKGHLEKSVFSSDSSDMKKPPSRQQSRRI